MREAYLTGDNERLDATDKDIDKALRPLSFDDFTGQEKIIVSGVFYQVGPSLLQLCNKYGAGISKNFGGQLLN